MKIMKAFLLFCAYFAASIAIAAGEFKIDKPCQYVSQSEAAQILGVSAKLPKERLIPGGGASCSYEAESGLPRVSVMFSPAASYEPMTSGWDGKHEPVTGLGEKAVWEFNDAGAGNLLFVKGDRLVHVSVLGSKVDKRTVALSFAQKIASKL